MSDYRFTYSEVQSIIENEKEKKLNKNLKTN